MLSNKKFFLLGLAVVMFIAALPFAIGQASAPSGSSFYGNKLIAPADYSIYYSYINQGAQGYLFMYDAFTSEAHAATIFQPLWFLVGMAAKLFNLSAPVAFAAARYATIPLFLGTLWWASGWIWAQDHRRRRIAFVATILASGLGAIMTFVGPRLSDFPWTYPDLWVSEAYSVLTLWSSAHFLLVTSGIVFVLVAVERSWLERCWSWAVWAGVVALATLMIHPFHMVTWALLWLSLTIWRWVVGKKIPWGYIWRWSTVVAMGSPALLLYALQLLSNEPLTVERAVQNINRSAVPWAMAVGLGVPLLFGLLGIWRWKEKNETWRWLVVLMLVYIAAAYVPLPFQRRLTQGMLLPMIWLSVPIFDHLIFSNRQRSTKFFVSVALGLVLSSSWLFIGGVIIKDYLRELRNPIRMYFIDREHQDLAAYLRTTDPHQPLLTTLTEGNVLAGLTAHQVYVGYGVETWHFADKLDAMDSFYTDMNEVQQRQLLQSAQLCYVLTSPRSRAKGSAFQPERWPDLSKAWSSTNLVFYQTPYCR